MSFSAPPVWCTQDVVSCSVLAQGCEGGFDFLIAGRYAQDQGVVAEDCNLYTALVSSLKQI